MASFWNLFGKTSISEPEAKGGSTVPSRQSQPRPRPPTPSAEANTPHDAPVPLKTHRSDRAADKLANALTAKYLCELNPKHSHKSNVYGLLARELHDLTRQALAFRTARLPPRVLCRLNAFIANLCSAVPESSALPKTLGRIRGRFRGQRRVPPAEEAEEEEEEEDLPQISEEDLKQRLDCYISALWAHADAASEREAAKEAYKGNPKAAAAAEKQAAAQLEFANLRADLARVHATLSSFVNVCVAQAALVPNMTILQNIRPRHLLTPLAESLCLEVLGVPDVDANTRERVASLVEEYERQHSFFQAADTNAKKVLTPLLQELVEWLRKNEDNLVANSATEGMLAVIPEDLRHQLKNQVYYSADHFFEVFNSVRPRLAKLPIPLHPLLEDTTMDAAQAMKDMYRERLLLNEAEVAPADVTRLLSDLVHSLLEIRLEDARRLERAAGETSPADPPLEASQSTSGSRHTRPHANLTEHLVMRTINAASRTTSGGDSFFIVQDLYGGDGVLVKQSAVTAPPIEIRVDQVSGVTVRSQDSYEIYNEEELSEAEDAYPLMIMHTAMIENIPLPPVEIIRKYMSRRGLAIEDDLDRRAILAEAEGDFLAGDEGVVVRRFLSLDAVRPRRKGRK